MPRLIVVPPPGWKSALRPLGPVAAQAIAQASNLGGQVTALALVGSEAFAGTGLGLLAAATVVFAGEMGYGLYFLREPARDPNWLWAWRKAVWHRLVVLAAAFGVAVLVMRGSFPASGDGLLTLLAAAPGIWASALIPTQLLYGLGLVRRAGLGMIVRFMLQGGGLVAASVLWPENLAVAGGGAFSLGILVQIAMGQAAGLPRAALCPKLNWNWPPRAALRLWGLSLIGVVNDRALPFVVGVAAPSLLAIAIIAVQVVQGLSSLLSQINALAVPALTNRHESGAGHYPPAGLLNIATMGLAAMALAAALWQPGLTAPGLLLAAEWHCAVAASWVFATLFAREREWPMAMAQAILIPLAVLVQFLAASHWDLSWLLLLRVGAAMAVAAVGISMGGRRAFGLLWPALALAVLAVWITV